MKDAHRSIWIVTAYVYKAIKEQQMDLFYQELVDEIEGVCDSLEVDLRAQRMYTLLLFYTNKVVTAGLRVSQLGSLRRHLVSGMGIGGL